MQLMVRVRVLLVASVIRPPSLPSHCPPLPGVCSSFFRSMLPPLARFRARATLKGAHMVPNFFLLDLCRSSFFHLELRLSAFLVVAAELRTLSLNGHFDPTQTSTKSFVGENFGTLRKGKKNAALGVMAA